MIHIMFAICSALWIYGSFYAKVKILSQSTRNQRLVISGSTCLELIGVRQWILTPLAPSLYWEIIIFNIYVKRAPKMPMFIEAFQLLYQFGTLDSRGFGTLRIFRRIRSWKELWRNATNGWQFIKLLFKNNSENLIFSICFIRIKQS